ncbi:MAG: S8 family serine peptidase [Candidatus Bathyarchaeia archaeon]
MLTSKGGGWIDLNLAIIYAANHGADIITMSLGGRSSLLFDTATQAAINYAYQKGCILVAAAGNDNNSEPFYPAAYDKVIAVSAIDQSDRKAEFSNFGDYIDICAPGVNILSTMVNSTYAYGSGTSFAAPFVAGVAALLLSKHPNLTHQEVTETLYYYAEDLGESGWDPYYGWGLVNAYFTITQTPIPEIPNSLSLTLIMALSGAWLYLAKKTTPTSKSSNGLFNIV